ncbi:MAG: DMT family transporter [Halofilum sp. (in: g-proteobacteria)]|nr:DMT family transporter [Halofilum sp. (in: g-proteobacteria)]
MSSIPRTAAAAGPGRYRQHVLLGALLLVVSEFLFATMGAAVKAVSAELPTAMIVFFRSLVGLVLFLPLVLRRRPSGLWPTPGTLRFHFLRAGLGVTAMACFFHALAHLPLADGMLLKMTAPMFMPVIAILWLLERPSRWALWAVPVGLAGVWLVLDPTGKVETAALVGLAGGLLAAGAKVSVRRLTRTEPATRVVFWFALLTTLVAAPFAAWQWQMPGSTAWLLLVAIGLCANAGQWFLSRGYGAASPGQIGPVHVFFGGVRRAVRRAVLGRGAGSRVRRRRGADRDRGADGIAPRRAAPGGGDGGRLNRA